MTVEQILNGIYDYYEPFTLYVGEQLVFDGDLEMMAWRKRSMYSRYKHETVLSWLVKDGKIQINLKTPLHQKQGPVDSGSRRNCPTVKELLNLAASDDQQILFCASDYKGSVKTCPPNIRYCENECQYLLHSDSLEIEDHLSS